MPSPDRPVAFFSMYHIRLTGALANCSQHILVYYETRLLHWVSLHELTIFPHQKGLWALKKRSECYTIPLKIGDLFLVRDTVDGCRMWSLQGCGQKSDLLHGWALSKPLRVCSQYRITVWLTVPFLDQQSRGNTIPIADGTLSLSS